MFNTDQFDYNAQTKMFSAEASQLGLAPGEVLKRLLLTNNKTGATKTFQHVTTTRRNDDLASWVYMARIGKIFVQLTIYND